MRMYVWKHPDFTLIAHANNLEQAREVAKADIMEAACLDSQEEALRTIALIRPVVWFRENAEYTESMNKASRYWADECDRMIKLLRVNGIDPFPNVTKSV